VKKGMKVVGLLLAVVLSLSWLTGCGLNSAKEANNRKGEIKIGCVLPLTNSNLGPKAAQAVQLAVEEINQTGGINGKKIKLYLEDDRMDAAASLQATKKLVELNGVKLLIGGTDAASMVVGPYAAEKKVLLMVPMSTSPRMTGQKWREYVFRTCPSDALQGKLMAQLAINEGYKKIALMVLDNVYGVSYGEVIKETLTGKAEVLAFIKYDPKSMDYRTELTRLKNLNPEAIIQIGHGPESEVIYQQADELGLDNIRWIVGECAAVPALLANPGVAAFMQKTAVGTRATAPDTKAREDFISAYTKKFKTPPLIYSDKAYDALKMLALALEKAKDDDPQKVSQALKEVGQNYEGASGIISFDQSNDCVNSFYEVWRVVKEAQEYKFERVKLVTVKQGKIMGKKD